MPIRQAPLKKAREVLHPPVHLHGRPWIAGDPHERYRFARVLGSGHYGSVYLCSDLLTGRMVAVKALDKHHPEFERHTALEEIRVLAAVCDHPNVVSLIEVWEDGGYVFIVQEPCGGGELLDRVLEERSFSERDAAAAVAVILDVIRHCHARGVLHRDVKPENWLLSVPADRPGGHSRGPAVVRGPGASVATPRFHPNPGDLPPPPGAAALATPAAHAGAPGAPSIAYSASAPTLEDPRARGREGAPHEARHVVEPCGPTGDPGRRRSPNPRLPPLPPHASLPAGADAGAPAHGGPAAGGGRAAGHPLSLTPHHPAPHLTNGPSFPFSSHARHAPTSGFRATELRAVDFGLSTFHHERARCHEAVGSSFYVAPEVLRGDYSWEADAWSAGVLTYVLLSGTPPFWGSCDAHIYGRILHAEPDFSKAVWKQATPAARDFVARLLDKDPSTRMTVDEALRHPWLADAAALTTAPLDAKAVARLTRFSRQTRLRKLMLTLAARHLSGDDIVGLRSLCAGLDRDGDGLIRTRELVAALEAAGLDARGEGVLEMLHGLEDTDAAGHVSVEEFVVAAADAQRSLTRTTVNAIFAAIDADADGYVGVEELSHALEECHIDVGADVLRGLINSEGALDPSVGMVSARSFADLLLGGDGGRLGRLAAPEGGGPNQGVDPVAVPSGAAGAGASPVAHPGAEPSSRRRRRPSDSSLGEDSDREGSPAGRGSRAAAGPAAARTAAAVAAADAADDAAPASKRVVFSAATRGGPGPAAPAEGGDGPPPARPAPRPPTPAALERWRDAAAGFAAAPAFKRLAMLVIARMIEPEDVAALREQFRDLDPCGSGQVTLRSIRSATNGALTDSEIAHLIKGLDVRACGTVDFDLFLAAALEEQGLVSESRLRAAFDVFDPSRSGTITSEAIAQVLSSVGMHGANPTSILAATHAASAHRREGSGGVGGRDADPADAALGADPLGPSADPLGPAAAAAPAPSAAADAPGPARADPASLAGRTEADDSAAEHAGAGSEPWLERGPGSEDPTVTSVGHCGSNLSSSYGLDFQEFRRAVLAQPHLPKELLFEGEEKAAGDPEGSWQFGRRPGSRGDSPAASRVASAPHSASSSQNNILAPPRSSLKRDPSQRALSERDLANLDGPLDAALGLGGSRRGSACSLSHGPASHAPLNPEIVDRSTTSSLRANLFAAPSDDLLRLSSQSASLPSGHPPAPLGASLGAPPPPASALRRSAAPPAAAGPGGPDRDDPFARYLPGGACARPASLPARLPWEGAPPSTDATAPFDPFQKYVKGVGAGVAASAGSPAPRGDPGDGDDDDTTDLRLRRFEEATEAMRQLGSHPDLSGLDVGSPRTFANLARPSPRSYPDLIHASPRLCPGLAPGSGREVLGAVERVASEATPVPRPRPRSEGAGAEISPRHVDTAPRGLGSDRRAPPGTTATPRSSLPRWARPSSGSLERSSAGGLGWLGRNSLRKTPSNSSLTSLDEPASGSSVKSGRGRASKAISSFVRAVRGHHRSKSPGGSDDVPRRTGQVSKASVSSTDSAIVGIGYD